MVRAVLCGPCRAVDRFSLLHLSPCDWCPAVPRRAVAAGFKGLSNTGPCRPATRQGVQMRVLLRRLSQTSPLLPVLLGGDVLGPLLHHRRALLPSMVGHLLAPSLRLTHRKWALPYHADGPAALQGPKGLLRAPEHLCHALQVASWAGRACRRQTCSCRNSTRASPALPRW